MKAAILTQQSEDTQNSRFLTFSLANENYGIDIKDVKEIIGIQPITTIPESPNYLKGIINLRGRIIPTVDMRIKFHKEPAEYTSRTCIIVIDVDNLHIGLIVDEVTEVVRITNENIAPPPNYGVNRQNTYIKGIGKVNEVITLLLDCKMLFAEQEIKAIKDIH